MKKDSFYKNPLKSDKDVFLAKKLSTASFQTGFYQVPYIHNEVIEKPIDLILWSQRNSCINKSRCGLVFYEFDSIFDGKKGIYNILKYGSNIEVNSLIDEISDFAFAVCPDYSVYGNFPNYKQIEALSKSREVGFILSTYGIKVIINYRATYTWSYELALSGMEEGQTVAIGTLGALKDKESRKLLTKSIDALVKTIKPKIIICYGSSPNDVFKSAINKGIEIWQYNSRIARSFEGGA